MGPPAGAAVAPLPAAESNQFDLVVRAERPLPPGPPASWPAEVPAADLPRHLWLLRSDRLLTCVCDNTGWTSERLGALLDGLGQAWLDRSDKARLDDFAADMAPLKQVAPARVDPGGLGRPAVWEVADGDPFAAEERALEAVLAPLRGSVIDIGAGPIRYLSLLAERIATGAVRYVAVEPDRAALVRTRDALPGAGLTRGEGEHLPIRSGVADHVLMLRSFNHLHDVPQAFSEASRVAAPGATLVVVDNVAFGLVRTPEQVAAARAIPVTETPFEHFRNANADAAVAAILATGAWRIDEVRAVAAGRANQWLVVARRLG